MKKYILILICLIFACQHANKASFKPDFITSPPVIVYKTKSDYNKNVPIILSDDKSEIVSYPHPSDLKVGNALALPTILKNGYLIDNRGIGKNVAFIKLTYEEYAILENPPSIKDLYNMIIDKDPLIEMCNCGNKKAIKNLENQLNSIIAENKLKTICKEIK